MIVIFLILIGIIVVWYVLVGSVHIPYCKKHKKPMETHGFYDEWRCWDCYTEDMQLRKRFE